MPVSYCHVKNKYPTFWIPKVYAMKLNPLFVPVIIIVTGAIALVLSIIVVVGNAKSDALQMYATVEVKLY